jgi:DNA-binding transcriptional MerR regulator
MGESIAFPNIFLRCFMSRKKGLLSIGDMSKLTGANIKSLRYYERLDILKPVFVDPDSSYRYYSFDQIYLIELIMICIEFDMPLKDFKQYIGDNETMDYQKFLKKCREIAEQKLKSVQRGLRLIDEIESKINLTESNKVGEIYSREFSEKYFYVKPCKMPLEYVDWIEIFNSLFETPHLHKEDSDLIFEYGLLYNCTPFGFVFYAFL